MQKAVFNDLSIYVLLNLALKQNCTDYVYGNLWLFTYLSTCVFNYFMFLKSRNHECPSFSLLSNLIIPFASKHFSKTLLMTGSQCILMGDNNTSSLHQPIEFYQCYIVCDITSGPILK